MIKFNKLKFKEDDVPSQQESREAHIAYWRRTSENARLYAIKAHEDVNHWYDDICKYEYHLQMTVFFACKYSHLFTEEEFFKLVTILWLHDTIEDAHKTFGDIHREFGETIAEAVRCCTNYGRGRTRAERMPDWLYDEIAANFLATAAKVFDRMANMSHSKFWGSSMYNKYKAELPHFYDKLNVHEGIKDIFYDLELI